jgi:hypothetical protein
MSIETNEFRTDEDQHPEQDETDETSEQSGLSGLPGQQDETDLAPSTGPDLAETEEAEWQEAGDADELQNAGPLETADELEYAEPLNVEQVDAAEQLQDPDQTETETAALETEPAELEGVAKPEDLGGRGVGDSGQPLVGIEARDEFLSRWERIQVSFVEDPAAAVEGAEVLAQEIGAAMLAAFEDRIGEFAAAGRAAADTEQRRLALRQYRAFIGVILP